MCVILLASFGFTICKKEKKKKRFRFNSLSSKKLKYLGNERIKIRISKININLRFLRVWN